jgi:hypothetical protein
MSYLEWLEKAVSRELAAGKIGTPVMVRLHLALSEDHGLLAGAAAAALASAGAWFGSAPLAGYAQGGAGAGYVSVLATYAGGQTALVNAEVARGAASLEALVIGNHGSLEFRDAPGAPGLRADLRPPAGPDIERWSRAIGESLRSGREAKLG